MNRRVLMLAVLLTPLMAACLVKDTTHRLYLSPDGAVDWTVLERDVRASGGGEADRWQEEQAYVDSVHANFHPALEAFRRLGADELSARLIRAERPYTTMVTARFQRADVLAAALLREFDVPASATLRRRADEATLTIAIDLSAVRGREDDVDTPVSALGEEFHRYRIVLTSGHFASADGFEIVEDGTAVELKPEQVPVDRPAVLRLTWNVR